jgi:acyl-CoA synthetase (AMP-forming)/AMP-acid ligase II
MQPPPLNLWNIFDAVASSVPDRTAIVFGSKRVNYQELQERSRRLANFFTAAGLGCRAPRSGLDPWQSGQDVIALYLHNGVEYLEASVASYGARAVAANVNYRYVADELVYLLNDAAAKVIIFHSVFSQTLADALPRLKVQPLLVQVDDDSGLSMLPGAISYDEALAASPKSEPTPIGGPPDPDDLYILYTGGTTGMPKGTLWRQADIFNAALGGDFRGLDVAGIRKRASAQEPQVLLPIAPFMHGAAHWVGLSGILLGNTVVVNSIVSSIDPVDVWTLVEREHVQQMLMVGEAFARPLLGELERAQYDTSSVRSIVLGGAVTSPETKERILRLIPTTTIVDVAGASETGAMLSAISRLGKATEAGVFRPGATTTVLNEERTAVLEPGSGERGWLAKSGHIPLGFLGDEAKTSATFPTVAGVRYTVPGDRAEMLEDGMVVLLGRDSVTINSAGEKIFAEEVEQALLRVPAVNDAVVVGRPSKRWGQEVVCVVSLADPSISDRDLIEQITGIARFKLPKAIVRVPEVLRSPSGKADYQWALGMVRSQEASG